VVGPVKQQKLCGTTCIKAFREALYRTGTQYGNNYPWHKTSDPFHVLIAEFLLRRTTRLAVADVFNRVIREYPTASALAKARPDHLIAIARKAGLRNRTRQLIDMAKTVMAHGEVSKDKNQLMAIKGVGPYISEAVLLYAFGVKAFPLDRNIQRIFYRVFLGKNISNRKDPSSDAILKLVAEKLTNGIEAGKVRQVHQGALTIAWNHCRAHPVCNNCPVRYFCTYAEGLN
jgi:A/G-specific adenine glycosylase